MCGILGTVNRPFGESTLDLLRHRGPDDSAITQSPIGGHLVTLGHRRLPQSWQNMGQIALFWCGSQTRWGRSR